MDVIIWWPVKAVLNIIFLFLWIPSIPFYELWNFIPEGIMLLMWYVDTFCLIMTFEILLWCILTSVVLGYLYITALPDQLTFPEVGSFLGFMLYNATRPNGFIDWVNT